MDDTRSIGITPRLTITVQAHDDAHPHKVTFVISVPAGAEALTLPKLVEQIDGVSIGSAMMSFADKETTLSLRRGPCEYGDRMDVDVYTDIFVLIAQQYHVEPYLVVIASVEDDGTMPLSRYLGTDWREYAPH